jgi:hypothetical protein
VNDVSESDEADTSGRETIPTSNGLSRVIPMSEVESDAHPNRSGTLNKTMVARWVVFLIDDSVYEER